MAPVLVVDMDGTLVRTDTLHETLLRVATRSPAHLPAILSALPRGKAAFKMRLAEQYVLPAESLPYNDAVLDLVRQARAEGRRTALVSAAHQEQVDAVARHLGLFDDAIGTGSGDDMALAGANLRGATKAELLTRRYGDTGFDYVGDSAADIPVWAAARNAYGVRPSGRVLQDASKARVTLQPVGDSGPPASRGMAYLRAMRPHQWSKNLLVFLPLLASHNFDAFAEALAAFIAFCACASSVYILNDLLDLPADRRHPRKRLRPFASGVVPLSHGVLMALGLLSFWGALSLGGLSPAFAGVLFSYFVASQLYSLWLKRKAIIDIVCLSCLYTIRVVAGAVAIGVILSPWLLAFSVFLFFSLAALKRHAELVDEAASHSDGRSGRGYQADDIPIVRSLSISAGHAAVLVFALYLYSDSVSQNYNRPELLWLICPILLYWLGRMSLMTHRGLMFDDPIVYALHDRLSIAAACAMMLTVLAATFWPA